MSYPLELVKKVNKSLEYYLSSMEGEPKILFNAMRYSVFSGGKRFRPILVILVAKSFKVSHDKVMPIACAIEFIHTFSLIHDDLPAIDNDKLRRGKPTCHIKFGEDIAILAGDALFSESLNLVLKQKKYSSDEVVLKLAEELSKATGTSGMIAGQVMDIISNSENVGKETLNFIHNNKTGKLIRASVRCGAIVSNADNYQLKKFTEFGEHLGLVFQITDDLLDEVGKEKNTGKRTGNDKALKKITYPSYYGLKKSKEIAKKEIELAKNSITDLNLPIQDLINIADFVLERKS
ncbi:MAG: polyprenyl synthetase family protein [Actinobacteria bacterium]|nr:polyprenyl synthetase family protein [Actinomycetota bacterium]